MCENVSGLFPHTHTLKQRNSFRRCLYGSKLFHNNETTVVEKWLQYTTIKGEVTGSKSSIMHLFAFLFFT